jgi:hypothetical protein
LRYADRNQRQNAFSTNRRAANCGPGANDRRNQQHRASTTSESSKIFSFAREGSNTSLTADTRSPDEHRGQHARRRVRFLQLLWLRMLRGLLLNAEQEWPSEAKRYGGEDEGVDQYISKVHEWKNATQTRTRFHCDDCFALHTISVLDGYSAHQHRQSFYRTSISQSCVCSRFESINNFASFWRCHHLIWRIDRFAPTACRGS